MKFLFSTIVGRGKGNEVSFTEEVEVEEDDPTNTELWHGPFKRGTVQAAWDRWNAGLVRGGRIIAPVVEE